MKLVETEIELAASLEDVWRMFTDLPAYERWNPFITHAEGELKVGSELRMSLKMRGRDAMDFHPKVIAFEPPKEVVWQGHVPGVFTGTHRFTFESLGPSRTRFRQHSEFRGLATRMLGDRFVEGGRQGFLEMEQALKKQVE
jgi:hypothetical protein